MRMRGRGSASAALAWISDSRCCLVAMKSGLIICSRERGRGDGHLDHLLHVTRIGAQHHDPVGQIYRFLEIVGDEDDGNVDLAPELQQVRLHQCAGLGIERRERLVHQQDAGPVRQRARDRHALLHAARELVGVGVGEAGQTHDLDPLARLGFGRGRALPAHLEPEHHVLEHGAPGEQGVALEHHAAVRARAVHRLAVEQHLARAGLVEPGQDPHQRGLAAARRADHAQQLAAVGAQPDPLERRDRAGVALEAPAQRLHVQDHRARIQPREARAHLRRLLLVARQRQCGRAGRSLAAGAAHAVSPSAEARRRAREGSRPRTSAENGSRVLSGRQGKRLRPSRASARSLHSPISPIIMIAA